MNDELAHVHPGDRLFLDGRFGQCRIVTVYRLTNTQIIIKHRRPDGTFFEVRYRRKDGRLIGADAYSGEWLRPLTPEREEAVLVKELKNKVRLLLNNFKMPNNSADLLKIVLMLEEIAGLGEESE